MLWLMNLDFAAGGAAAIPDTTPSVAIGGVKQKLARRKQRLYVEIDNQYFPVQSFQEAEQLLLRARALAESQSEKQAERATKLLKKKIQVPKVQLAVPQIEVSPELRVELAPLINDIERLYRQASEVAELRLLMALAQEQDEEDVFILLN
jgi:hypothetical protein